MARTREGNNRQKKAQKGTQKEEKRDQTNRKKQGKKDEGKTRKHERRRGGEEREKRTWEREQEINTVRCRSAAIRGESGRGSSA